VKMVDSGKTKADFHYALSSSFLQVFFVKTNFSPDVESWIEIWYYHISIRFSTSGNTRAKYLVIIGQDELGACHLCIHIIISIISFPSPFTVLNKLSPGRGRSFLSTVASPYGMANSPKSRPHLSLLTHWQGFSRSHRYLTT
jgi:hypothetical protein